MLKGAEIVLQCLRAEGVDLVFGYPGGAIMPLYDAFEGSTECFWHSASGKRCGRTIANLVI